AYASDTERVCEAVRRAAKQLGRPVTVQEVKDEIDLDLSLHPAGLLSLRSILQDMAKKTVSAGGERRMRVTRRVYKVGRVDGDVYYCTEDPTGGAAYVRLRQLK